MQNDVIRVVKGIDKTETNQELQKQQLASLEKRYELSNETYENSMQHCKDAIDKASSIHQKHARQTLVAIENLRRDFEQLKTRSLKDRAEMTNNINEITKIRKITGNFKNEIEAKVQENMEYYKKQLLKTQDRIEREMLVVTESLTNEIYYLHQRMKQKLLF